MKIFADFKTPHPQDHESFANHIFDEKPLCFKENVYLERGEDLLTLADGQEIGWLDVVIGRILDVLPKTV